MFDCLPSAAADPLHAVMDRFRGDPRSDKIDLGVGVFRSADGLCHAFAAVHEAEQRLVDERRGKAYLPLSGDPAFLHSMEALVFGQNNAGSADRVVVQATGGTGALRLALDFVARTIPTARVHLGLPSWPNHAALAKAAGLAVVPYDYLDSKTRKPDRDSVLAAAAGVTAGDVFILHGPCHNPSGLDLPRCVRDEAITSVVNRGGVPLIDAAYCGLADGLEVDLRSLRQDLALAPRALMAISCSKSFGLYRERTAVLMVQCCTRNETNLVRGHLEELSRSLVSMPPAHGAAVVATILQDAKLHHTWRSELEHHRQRTLAVRAELDSLANCAAALSGANAGRGIFMLLPIDAKQVCHLEQQNGIYLPTSGRINITGLKSGDPVRLAEALASC